MKKFAYFKPFIESTVTSSLKLCNKINPLINPNKKSTINAAQIIKDPSFNSNIDAANAFVNFFSSITANIKFLDISTTIAYIQSHLNHRKNIITTMPFEIAPFTIKEVEDALKSISADSAKRSTGIESKILKDCADILAFQTFIQKLPYSQKNS